MASPNVHTMEAMLKDWQNRLVAVERRLARTGAGLPGRLSATGQEVADWDLAIDTGWYWGLNALNQPPTIDGSAGTWYTGYTLNQPNGPRRTQIVYESRTTTFSTPWSRYWNGSSWTTWVGGGIGGEAVDLQTIDIDTVQTNGFFIQDSNADATLVRNYPIARAGHLLVQARILGTATDFAVQTFTEYQPLAPATTARQWRRTNYNGVWTAWAMIGASTPTWTTLTTLNSWVGTGTLGYRMSGDVCYLSGELYGGTNQTVAFNLPVEARPANRLAPVIARYATTSVPPLATLAINTTGDCIVNVISGTLPTAAPGFALRGVAFPIT